MNKFYLMIAALFVVGCGGGESKVADKPSSEQVEAFEKEMKEVEDAERGTPIKAKGK